MAREDDDAGERTRSERDASADPIDHIRELLFGAPKRETIDQIRVLEIRMEEMRADFLARLGAVESRMSQIAHEGDERQTAALDAIGGAIAQLGASIQSMAARRKEG